MITFASKEIEEQWDKLHPELQSILNDFGHFAASNKLPLTVVTCIGRSQEQNDNIYNATRFSWHIPDIKTGIIRAFDMRTRHYTVEQKAKVIAWFNNRCPDPQKFELIYKPHGTGPHLHLAVREH